MRKHDLRSGFTLLECLVAMFVLLVGLMGIVAVFNAGISARLQAEEMVVSSDLATMWGDWKRFGISQNDPSASIGQGASGNFFTDAGLPTAGCNVYRGYTWRISASDSYTPQWMEWMSDGTVKTMDWGTRLDGNATSPLGTPSPLKKVTLTISRGPRSYSYYFVFSKIQLQCN